MENFAIMLILTVDRLESNPKSNLYQDGGHIYRSNKQQWLLKFIYYMVGQT